MQLPPIIDLALNKTQVASLGKINMFILDL